MVEAALARRAEVLRSNLRPPGARHGRGAERICAVGRPGTGTVDGVVIVVTDVTEQRVAERALRESEARFRRIANSAPAMMWVTRLDRVRDFVNDAYVEFACGPGCDPRRRGRSTGARGSIPTTSTGSSPRASPARRRCSASRSRAATGATTASIAGCAPCRSRASAPDGELVGFIGVGDRHHARQGGRARASPAGRGADRAAGRVARRSSARCSRRRSR